LGSDLENQNMETIMSMYGSVVDVEFNALEKFFDQNKYFISEEERTNLE
jgi:hypothetical protein